MKSSVYSIRVSYQLLNAIFEELDRLEVGFSSVSGALLAFTEYKLAELGSDLSISDEEAIELVANRVQLCGKQTRAKATLRLTSQGQTSQSGAPLSKGAMKQVLASMGSAQTESNWSPAADLDFAPSSFNSNFEFNLEDSEKGFGLDEVLSKGSEIVRQETRQLDEDANDDLEQILQDSIAELERESSEELLAKLTGAFQVAEAIELPATLTKAKAISARDPRLEKDKLWKAFLGEQDEAKMYALRIVYFNLPESYWSSEKAEQMLIQLLENLG